MMIVAVAALLLQPAYKDPLPSHNKNTNRILEWKEQEHYTSLILL